MTFFEILAENRIKDAIDRGELDNLPGAGKPLVLEDPPPYVSRETWLAMKMMKNAGVAPQEIQLLKRLGELKEALAAAKTKEERKRLLKEIHDVGIEARERMELAARHARR